MEYIYQFYFSRPEFLWRWSKTKENSSDSKTAFSSKIFIGIFHSIKYLTNRFIFSPLFRCRVFQFFLLDFLAYIHILLLPFWYFSFFVYIFLEQRILNIVLWFFPKKHSSIFPFFFFSCCTPIRLPSCRFLRLDHFIRVPTIACIQIITIMNRLIFLWGKMREFM